MATVRASVQKLLARLNKSPDRNIPGILLVISDLLEQFKDSLHELRAALWDLDILRTLVDILQYDFPNSFNRSWSDAVKLTECLSKSCLGLKTEDGFSKLVVDRILQVALKIQGLSPMPSLDFRKLMQSLYLLVEDSPVHTLSLLKSEFFLQMFITDHPDNDVEHQLLRLLKMTLNLLEDCTELDQETISLYFDELLYKIYNDSPQSPGLQQLAADVLLAAAKRHTPFKYLLIARGEDNPEEVLKEIKSGPSSHNKINVLLWFIQKCKEEESEKERLNGAAVRIQSAFRSYRCRKDLSVRSAKVAKFQQRFRSYMREKRLQEEKSKANEYEKEMEKERRIEQRRAALNHEAQILSSLPAKQIPHYYFKIKSDAASKIQAAWRMKCARKQVSEMRNEREKTRAATVIQQAYRKHRGARPTYLHDKLPEGLTPHRIRELRDRVADLGPRDNHVTRELSDEEAFELAQSLYQQYSKRVGQVRKREREQSELCSKIEDQITLVRNFPSLNDSTLEHVTRYTSHNPLILRHVRADHRTCVSTPMGHHQVTRARQDRLVALACHPSLATVSASQDPHFPETIFSNTTYKIRELVRNHGNGVI